jgi:hypothetical protein
MEERQYVDPFDRIIGSYEGLPDHIRSKPSTVTTVLPMVGNSQSYIVRTVRTDKGEFVGFVEMIESGRHVRMVIPAKAMAAIYRQRESLIKTAARNRGKEHWRTMDDDAKAAALARLGTKRR